MFIYIYVCVCVDIDIDIDMCIYTRTLRSSLVYLSSRNLSMCGITLKGSGCAKTLFVALPPLAIALQPWKVDSVRTQEKACCSDSRFRRKLSGTTGHRLLGTQRPQMLCVAAWVWFCLSTEFVDSQVNTHTHAHTHTHTHTHPPTHAHAHTRARAHTHTHIHAHAHAHKHTHTHIHTHRQTHRQTDSQTHTLSLTHVGHRFAAL